MMDDKGELIWIIVTIDDNDYAQNIVVDTLSKCSLKAENKD